MVFLSAKDPNGFLELKRRMYAFPRRTTTRTDIHSVITSRNCKSCVSLDYTQGNPQEHRLHPSTQLVISNPHRCCYSHCDDIQYKAQQRSHRNDIPYKAQQRACCYIIRRSLTTSPMILVKRRFLPVEHPWQGQRHRKSAL